MSGNKEPVIDVNQVKNIVYAKTKGGQDEQKTKL